MNRKFQALAGIAVSLLIVSFTSGCGNKPAASAAAPVAQQEQQIQNNPSLSPEAKASAAAAYASFANRPR
jgi:hypothetical protein